ncbi:MobF family relaxase [Nocardioides sp. NPDC051685]|uniref:MobF family relaxase n=1 Tax=Nocardioides sp. NPDC051685 TaxID=3364334 RepID=UPI0037AF4E4E
MKTYHGAARDARNYLEADRSRADDYYLDDGSGLARRYGATPEAVADRGMMDGLVYERWVAGFDVETGCAKGRLLKDRLADGTNRKPVRFVEVTVNGPKTWSLAAALHAEIGDAYEAAQQRAAREIIGWLAQHATTRVGPKGRQVQVPVEELEAAVITHYTSRAGDPHRHLHLQISSRVFAEATWRGLHTVGVRDSLAALNGIGHAAVMCDPEFRGVLAAHGYTLDLTSGELQELRRFVGEFSSRAAQIRTNVERYEATWRGEHPGEHPGPRLRRAWDARAWADARPDKVAPVDGVSLAQHWIDELFALGYRPPRLSAGSPSGPEATAIGRLDRDLAAQLVIDRLGASASAWNAADVRGGVERLVAEVGIVAVPEVRRELAEDLTARAIDCCRPLLPRGDVPEHVRSLTSRRVLDVEADLNARLALRAETSATLGVLGRVPGLDQAQRAVVMALIGEGRLLVIEGAAGSGKTRTLAVAAAKLQRRGERMLVVTPTKKAANVAAREVRSAASSAAWLAWQHGFRWDEDGRWGRVHADADGGRGPVDRRARLGPGDLLVVDEAGMLDQDLTRALLILADESGARVAFVGDRHQLPAVGRGGVLDLAARWADDSGRLTLDVLHRFADTEYADLSLKMRAGRDADTVFDQLLARGEIVIHGSDVERLHALATLAADAHDLLITADTREQVAALNAAARQHRLPTETSGRSVVTDSGEQIGAGDRITTRQNSRKLDVANRDCWTVTGVSLDGGLRMKGAAGHRRLPAAYVTEHVELAYASTIHGAQGETVNEAHLLLGERTSAAAAYVGMTRGRRRNVAHLVADDVEDARRQWVEVFGRDRADLGPAHAAQRAVEDIERYGSNGARRYVRRPSPSRAAPSRTARAQQAEPSTPWSTAATSPERGVGL